MSKNKRVCLRHSISGELFAATYVRYASSRFQWSPIPEGLGFVHLAREDDHRPEGVHPALFYGFGVVPAAPEWIATHGDGDAQMRVQAYSAGRAMAICASHNFDVDTLERAETWY